VGERAPHTDPSALHEPLAAELMTPKHRIAAQNIEIGRERLLDSKQLKIIGAAYEQSPLAFEDATNAAVLVGHLVRQTLEFAPTTDGTPLLTAESIAERETANCYGYTIVASECLDQIKGLEHYIGYVNQHAVIMLFDRPSQRSFLLDVPTNELCKETTEAISGKDPQDQLMSGELRAVNWLQTSELVKNLPPSINRDAFVSSRPWLNFADVTSQQYRDGDTRNSLLQLITLPSIPGRELLRVHYDAIIHNRHEEFSAAYESLSQLPGIYPDVDRRNDLKEADRLCKKLISQGMGQQAIELAQTVHASLSPGDTTVNRFFLGDILRKVATATGSVELVEQAIQTYEHPFVIFDDNADNIATSSQHLSRGFKNLQRNKVNKAREQAKRMKQ
jgi:hypothetical protein